MYVLCIIAILVCALWTCAAIGMCVGRAITVGFDPEEQLVPFEKLCMFNPVYWLTYWLAGGKF